MVSISKSPYAPWQKVNDYNTDANPIEKLPEIVSALQTGPNRQHQANPLDREAHHSEKLPEILQLHVVGTLAGPIFQKFHKTVARDWKDASDDEKSWDETSGYKYAYSTDQREWNAQHKSYKVDG